MANNIVIFSLYCFRYIGIIANNVWRPNLRKHTQTDHANMIYLWKDIKKMVSIAMPFNKTKGPMKSGEA